MLKEKRRYTNTSGSFTTKYYYYPDRIGSVYMICDDHGMILEKANDGAFGEKKSGVGISKFGLTSNMYDTDTGLYYFAARWYDSKIGRFLEMDPVLTEAGMMNMYEYCASNPANFIDRYGELWGFDSVQEFVDGLTYDDMHSNGGPQDVNKPEQAYSEGEDSTLSEEPTKTPEPPRAGPQAQEAPGPVTPQEGASETNTNTEMKVKYTDKISDIPYINTKNSSPNSINCIAHGVVTEYLWPSVAVGVALVGPFPASVKRAALLGAAGISAALCVECRESPINTIMKNSDYVEDLEKK